MFLPILLIIWLLAVFAQSELLFGIVWSLLGMYIVFRLWVGRNAASMRISRQMPSRAYTGGQIQIETHVRNTGILPMLWAEVDDSLPPGLGTTPPRPQVLSLGAHGKEWLRYELTCKQRGYYHFGPLRVRCGDPLGLSERSFEAGEPGFLIVYPRVVSLRRLGLPTHSALVALPARAPLFEDPASLVGVRDYLPTDSLRRIHWTATARTGHLMVKEFRHATARTTMICLDFQRRDYKVQERERAMELAIVVAASIASHVVSRERLPVGLRIEGHDPLAGDLQTMHVPPGSNAPHLMMILELLARVQSAGDGDFADALRDEGRNLQWGSTVVAISGSQSEVLGEALAYLQKCGHAVALILVNPDPVARGVARVPVYRVWDDKDLAAV
ncbi:MAG: DUF58 domain-containing protein [Chloroflexota bacterium]|nr:DUF58 domain-containing protein [Chloroflexota bacterium]